MPIDAVSSIEEATAIHGTGIGSGKAAAAADKPYGKLPWQAEDKPYIYSLARDMQFAQVLGAALHKTVGQGVISGGKFTKVGILDGTIESGTRIFSGGVCLRLLEDAVVSGVNATGTTYVWGSVLRTPAVPSSPGSGDSPDLLDQFGLDIELTATSTPPSNMHFLFVVLTGDGVEIDSSLTDNAPEGKFIALNNGIARPREGAVDVAGTGDIRVEAEVALSQALVLTGILTGARNVLLPLWNGAWWIVDNRSSGAFDLTVKGPSGTGVVVPQGASGMVWSDGTNFYGVRGSLPTHPLPDYTITNGVTDRSYDANSTTVDELADVLYTLIADLTAQGFLQ